MCTMIVELATVTGCGKGAQGWFAVNQASVSFDHPFNAPYEHALNIDFVDETAGPSARVAVELEPESARRLAHAILAALDRGRTAGV